MRASTTPASALTTLLSLMGVAIGLVSLWPTDASAHTYLESSDPAADSKVLEALDAVELVFNQPVGHTIATVQVAGPAADLQSTKGDPRITDERVKLFVHPLPVHGEYTVRYRVISFDGHPVKGRFSFTYAGPLPEPRDRADDAKGERTRSDDGCASASGAQQGAPNPTACPESGRGLTSASVAQQRQPTTAAVAGHWLVLAATAAALMATVVASVYAIRTLARWRPDAGP